MILHRYMASHGLETLQTLELKAAKLSSFNDPFEYTFTITGKLNAPVARKYLEKRIHDPDFWLRAQAEWPNIDLRTDPVKILKKNLPILVANLVSKRDALSQITFRSREAMLDKSTRVVCFSGAETKDKNQVLLWAHYADKHNGIRIEFDFPSLRTHNFYMSKVTYQDSPATIDIGKRFLDEFFGEFLVECAKVKSTAWEYENEYRLLTHPDRCLSREIKGKQEFFVRFDLAWVKSVFFGVRFKESDISSYLELNKQQYGGKINFYRAKMPDGNYNLEYVSI